MRATTKAGSVSSPLRSRFGFIPRFEFYTQEELSSIIKRSAKILEIGIENDAAMLLAQCCRGTPRGRMVTEKSYAHLGLTHAADSKDGGSQVTLF